MRGFSYRRRTRRPADRLSYAELGAVRLFFVAAIGFE